MGKTAFIFPGQGSQFAGMGKELAAEYESAASTFDETDAALGFKLSTLCFDGPEDELQLTANTQPALVAVSVATLRVVSDHGVRPDFVAGHSLGEYSALVAARSLNLGDALRLVRRRGELMQDAVPVGVGAMAAILGLDADVVEAACLEAAEDEICAPANLNAPSQTVIAGHSQAVARAIELCKKRGARKTILLKVSAPFHCALMQPAQDGLAEPLSQTTFEDLACPLINNVDARLINTGEEARHGLLRQMTSVVRWTETITCLIAAGVTSFVEVGPKKVLSGLVKSINRDVTLLNVEDCASLQTALQSLG